MEIYHCKRFIRFSAGDTHGTPTDTISFAAHDTAEAEKIVRRRYRPSISQMNWDKEFATLEDGAGNVIAQWRDGTAFA